MSRSNVLIRINGNAENFKRTIDGIKKETRTLESSLKSIATKGALAFAGLGAGIGATVAQAAKFEQINTQFDVLIGNAEDSKKALDELKDFSAGTPFEFESIAKAGQQLLGFGFAADELRPKLEQIGNVAAAVGKPIDEIGLIFGQVAAAGKLTGERLLQFQERAIPIGPAIAETLGVAESSVKDLVSSGAVSFATFEKAFASLSQKGGIAFGALDKQSQTVSGQFSTLKDNISLLAADFGTQFLPVVKSVTQSLISFIQVLRDNPELTKYGAIVVGTTTAIAGLVTVLAGAGIALIKFKVAIAAAAAASPAFAAGLTAIKVAATAAGTALKFALANPIGLVLTGLVALGIAAYNFRDELRAAFGGALDVVNEFTQRASSNLEGFKTILAGIFTLNFDQIKQGFAQLTDLSDAGFNAGATFSAGFKSRMDAFKEEEAERLDELKDLRVSKKEEENEALLEKERELRENLASQGLEFDELQIEQDKIKAQKLANNDQKAKDKRLKEQQKFQKQQLRLDQLQANAQIGLANATANLLNTVSKEQSRTSFLISKAAAIAQSIISTNVAYAQALATPPGPPTTFPLAAQVGIAGRINTAAIVATAIQGFNQGGIVTGGQFGRDSVPAMLTPGEIVAPRQNFNEVVTAVADRRNRENRDEDSGQVSVVIGFRDEAFEIIEEKLIERERNGTSLRGS